MPRAETLLFNRLIAGASDPKQAAQHRAGLAAFLARPRLHDPTHHEMAAAMQLEALRQDPTASPEALLSAAEAMVASMRDDRRSAYSLGPLVLAERTLHLERAEAIAREGLLAIDAYMAARAEDGTDPAVIKAIRDDLLCSVHDALGVVLTAAGRLDEAEAALGKAAQFCPTYPLNLMHRAALARRRGDPAAAQSLLVAGLDQAYTGERNPCELALEQAYQAEHGNLKGFRRHLERLMAGHLAARRAERLATAIAEPALPPPFALVDLDGNEVTSEALRGKITVIKFWFTTCHPCVDELPEFQALADAYARDPGVEILSIARYGEAAGLREWMREHGYHFKVLVDQGYCDAAKIHVFPTIWVLDREGRVAFTRTEATRRLREEFGWRIESLRPARGARPRRP